MNVRVLGTDGLMPLLTVDSISRVTTQQRKRMSPCEFIPEHFELNRRLALPSAPQDVNHFAVCAHHRFVAVSTNAFDRLAHDLTKLRGVRTAVHHERVDRLSSVENDQAAVATEGVEVEPAIRKFACNQIAMVWRCDQDGGLACGKAVGEKVGHRVTETLVIPVKLDRVMTAIAWQS
jgi:hypothetical protein